jgi:hypothetical protein
MANDLLETLSEDHLPALPSEPQEPSEPREIDRSDVVDHGRRPDEVVSREARLPASEEEQKYEVGGRRYSARELEESGLLNDLAATHSKYSQLQAAQAAQLEAARQAEAQAQVPQITNSMIAKIYDSISEIITQDLVDNYLVESDLPEAYPRAFKTLVGQLRFAVDKIFEIEATVIPFIRQVQQAQQTVQAQVVTNAYNAQLNALFTSDPSFYAGLKNQKTRDAFTRFLVEEVHANVGQTTGAGAPAFLKKQWAAFNSSDILSAAKSGVEARKQRQYRRNIVGETPGSRGGVGSFEESHLERMIANSGKIPQ